MELRAQLKADHVLTSHQITIDRHRQEVSIGYESAEEVEIAKEIIRINYFSKEQYLHRWEGAEDGRGPKNQ